MVLLFLLLLLLLLLPLTSCNGMQNQQTEHSHSNRCSIIPWLQYKYSRIVWREEIQWFNCSDLCLFARVCVCVCVCALNATALQSANFTGMILVSGKSHYLGQFIISCLFFFLIYIVLNIRAQSSTRKRDKNKPSERERDEDDRNQRITSITLYVHIQGFAHDPTKTTTSPTTSTTVNRKTTRTTK